MTGTFEGTADADTSLCAQNARLCLRIENGTGSTSSHLMATGSIERLCKTSDLQLRLEAAMQTQRLLMF